MHEYYEQRVLGLSPKVKVDRAYLRAQAYAATYQEQAIAYWQNALKCVEQVNDLNGLLSKTTNLDKIKTLASPQEVRFQLAGDAYQALKSLIKAEGLTTNVLVQFAWHKLLQVYTGDAQTVVGTTVSGRTIPVPGIEASVGLFINTLPLIITWQSQRSVREQLRQIHQQITELNNHSVARLASLQQEGRRLFHSLFVFENYPVVEQGLAMSPRAVIEKLDYPLAVMAYERNNSLQVHLRYEGSYLTAAKAEQLVAQLKEVLEQIPVMINEPQSALSLVGKASYQQMIVDWNATEEDYPKDKTIHQLFEEQVLKTPDKIALVFEEETLSYQSLNEQSNQLARFIRQQYRDSLPKDCLVALCLDKSFETIIGILGVLKAGAAYVPIDASHPVERIHYLLADTQTQLVLTQTHLVKPLQGPKTLAKLIAIDSKPYQNHEKSNLPAYSQAADLAYVIYTSGSTGLPKGVMVEHRNVVLHQHNLYSKLGRLGRVDYSTTFSADLSVATTVLPLMSGDCICIYAGHLSDIEAYVAHLIHNKVDTLKTVPTVASYLMSYLNELTVSKVIVCGEKFDESLLALLTRKDLVIADEYGPTEATVGSCIALKYPDRQEGIGRPFPNYTFYVLNGDGLPVPLGAVGELHIGGAGLARGYLNQSSLTKERFITNPYASESDKAEGYTRLYKTGDLVRWLADGNIEYVGRNDFQVKIRGYRIELGEIEQSLLSYAGITQSVVVALENESERRRTKYLVAYYVSQNPVDEALLRNHLAKRLPDYMVPSAFISLGTLPLTISGKLDRAALPKPDFQGDEYVAPRTALEKKLCEIWQRVLGLNQVGIEDDFYRLGGDSILSIQLTSKLRANDIVCGVNDIFEQRTVEHLAHYLTTEQQATKIVAEQGVLTGRFGLLPIQSWFFEQHFKYQNHWNQSFLIQVPPLSLKRFEELLPKLIKQHDMLRVRYVKNAVGCMEQVYYAHLEPPKIKILDLSSLSEEEGARCLVTSLNAWQSEFDIERGPLWQLGYIHGYSNGSARLFFALHHLIIDSVSWRILINDLQCLYEGHSLKEKTSSYRQWVEIIQEYAKTNQDELVYWQAQHEEKTNYPKLVALTNETHFTLDKAMTGQLLSKISLAYHTEINDVLLTALAYAWQECFGQSDLVITLEGHGREPLNEAIDLSHTVGWFTVLYPLKLSIKASISESIKHIKEQLRQVPNKGIGYGSLRYGNAKDAAALPALPPIFFNYLGQFGANKKQGFHYVNEFRGVVSHPDNGDNNLVTVNGLVVNGEFSLRIATRFNRATSQRLSRVYKAQLKSIIEHCLERIKTNQCSYTPSDFSSVSISQTLLDELQKGDEIEAIHPANSLQQGFIYQVLSQPNDHAYRLQALWDYETQINSACYKEAWILALQTYPALRTCFNWEEELIQITLKKGQLQFVEHDIRKEKDKDKAISAIRLRDQEKGFQLNEPKLLRLYLIQRGSGEFTVLKSMHHSIIDGWSGPILINKVHEYYGQLLQGIRPEVVEDRAYLRAQAYATKHQEQALAYWKTALKLMEQVNDLNVLLSEPTDLDRIRTLAVPRVAKFQLEGDAYQALKSLVKTEGLTTNVLVQFAWHKLLHVYTGDAQTIVGTTVSGRTIPVPGIEESVGLFINTLPLIVTWDRKRNLREQLQHIHQQTNELNNHSIAHLAALQQEGRRLFHSLFMFENYPVLEYGANSLSMSTRSAINKLDYLLAVVAYEVTNGLQISLQYEGHYLTEAKAELLVAQLKEVLLQLPMMINEAQSALSLVSKASYQQMIIGWNATERDYPQDKTIHQLFEEQVLKTPDKIALVFEGKRLTYQALNEQSNQLARLIREHFKASSPKDSLVALCLDKSLEVIIGILGVLKAGAAYVPIDPSYPAERIHYLLEDTKAQLVLTQLHLIEQLRGVGKLAKLIALDSQPYQAFGKTNLPVYSQAKDLAYVIYTSGTTGLPKGVMIEHKSLANHVYSQRECLGINNESIILQYASLVFDASVWEIFGAIAWGAQLVILPESKRKDPKSLIHYLIQNRITMLVLPPALLSGMDYQALPDLKVLAVAGEVCELSLMEKWSQGKRFINLYGPTEGTICLTAHEYKTGDLKNNIGKPFPNVKVYILDKDCKPVPIGAIGELYIGGACLARGYLNQSTLTKERFIANPFASESDKVKGYTRLYKTGDLVRWLADGNIEYVGRNDFQVKIRGYRIELGEIEQILLSYEGIQQTVVLVLEKESTKYLAAYYVSQEPVDEDLLRNHLAKRLPDYMVPSAFISLETLPLTISGKLDRASLPEPDFQGDERSYVAPRTALEIKLCEIWQRVLGLTQVGIEDDFFRLGGNSILAIQLISKMNKILETQLAISDIFRHKNISNMTDDLINIKAYPLIKPLNTRNKKVPLMYFVHPGAAGCEVYQSLANLLESHYQSIGIDNYNIQSDVKINSLSLIANYYIEKISQTFPFSEEVNLCGWSLGGKIALEMACKLEQKGFKKINVYLLDTVLDDDNILDIESTLDKNSIAKNLLGQNIDENYRKKIDDALDANMAIRDNSISRVLEHTEVTLFKAVELAADKTNNESKTSIYISSKDNNVQTVVRKRIRIEKLNCHHGNILQKTEDIIRLMSRKTHLKPKKRR